MYAPSFFLFLFSQVFSTETAPLTVRMTFCILLTMETYLFLLCLIYQLPVIQYTIPFFSNILNTSLAYMRLLSTGFFPYLTNRTRTVTVNNCSSAPVPVSCRVPQGSVLGPDLFILYTASLSDVMYSHSVLHHPFAAVSYTHLTLPTTAEV